MSHSREGLRGRAPVPARAIRKALEERRRTDPTVTEEDIIAEISAKVQGQPEPKPKPASDFEPVTHHEPTPELLEQVKRQQQQEKQATNQTVVKEPARPERKVPEPTRRTETRSTTPKQVPIQTQLQEKKESTRESVQPSPQQPPRNQQVTETKEVVSKPKRTTIKGPPRKPVVRDKRVGLTDGQLNQKSSRVQNNNDSSVSSTSLYDRFQSHKGSDTDWLMLDGLFDKNTIAKEPLIQIRNLEEPLLLSGVEHLKNQLVGYQLKFPGFTYEVTGKNKCFNQMISYVRYLSFQSLFHRDGRHVQYAKQWLLSYNPHVFEPTFDISQMNNRTDALDIYVLVYAMYDRFVRDIAVETGVATDSYFHDVGNQLLDSMSAMQRDAMGVQNGIVGLFNRLSERFDRIERMNMTTLLDRMGLLELPQGYPKDVDSLVTILESNREVYDELLLRLQKHEMAEVERKKRFY